MFSSDKIKRLLLHCLWVDGNAGYRIFADHFELFSCDAVRSSGFNCKLKHMLQVKILPDRFKQTVKLVCLECCRCSAADIYGIQRLSLHQLCCSFQFFDHRIKVTIDLIFPLSDWWRAEWAVGADAWTEWNSCIQAIAIFTVQLIKKCLFTACNLIRNLCFFIANTILFF